MSRFFVPADLQNPLKIGENFTLPPTVSHHWVKVLRAKIGDSATLFDGTGGEYAATLTHIDKKSSVAYITDFNPINRTPPFHTNLGLVMSRGDRMDYAIQKSCEMGVTNIQLLTSERCQEHLKYERDLKKLTHWQGVAIAACEQCGLNLVPKVLAPISLMDFVKNNTDELKLILAISHGNLDWQPFKNNFPKNISLLIGAEGGLSPAEIDFAISHGFKTWTIGERVLRTETAPVVALAVLQTIYALNR